MQMSIPINAPKAAQNQPVASQPVAAAIPGQTAPVATSDFGIVLKQVAPQPAAAAAPNAPPALTLTETVASAVKGSAPQSVSVAQAADLAAPAAGPGLVETAAQDVVADASATVQTSPIKGKPAASAPLDPHDDLVEPSSPDVVSGELTVSDVPTAPAAGQGKPAMASPATAGIPAAPRSEAELPAQTAVQNSVSLNSAPGCSKLEGTTKKTASKDTADPKHEAKTQDDQNTVPAVAIPPATLATAVPLGSVAPLPAATYTAASSDADMQQLAANGPSTNKGGLAAHHDSLMAGTGQAAQQPDQTRSFAVALPAAQPASQATAPGIDGFGLAASSSGSPSVRAAEQAAFSQTDTRADATTATTTASPAAQQAAAAMISLGAGPDPGTQRLTIAMTPLELGHVIVQIDRLADGSASVAVSATHASTLAALHNDRPALEQALTQAGVSVSHRTIEFRLETPASSGSAQYGSAGSSASMGGGTMSGQQGRQASARSTSFAGAASTATADADSSAPTMRRFGINLTA